MRLTSNRGAGDLGKFALGAHPEGGLTVKELDQLYLLAKMMGIGAAAGNFFIQKFRTVVPAAGTTDVTFADTVDVCSILGGIMSVTGVDATFEFDLGYTSQTDKLIDDFNAGAVEDKEVVITGDYLQSGEDIILTINSNSNTVSVTVDIIILTVKLITT